MSNNDYKYTLEIIIEHIEKCEKRFLEISTAEDFVATEYGIILLDSIVVRLQSIGENVKNIFKKSSVLNDKYPHIEWNKIIRFRDFISHIWITRL